MLSPNNLLKLSDGRPVAVPSQDMVLGAYYLTLERDGDKGEGMAFKDEEEVIMAYENFEITLHAKIKVRRKLEFNGIEESCIVTTTAGRIIFNEAIPQNLGFVNRSEESQKFRYEIEMLADKKTLGRIVEKCIKKHGSVIASEMLDKIKSLGYKYSTRGALTVSVSDMKIPEKKREYLQEAEQTVEKVTKLFRRGLMTDEERYNKVIDAWNKANEEITEALMEGLGIYNNIYMMAHSGARGSKAQIKQLAGMRGLMASPSGRIIELPIKSNFREGLTVLEYFLSAHGARKGLVGRYSIENSRLWILNTSFSRRSTRHDYSFTRLCGREA